MVSATVTAQQSPPAVKPSTSRLTAIAPVTRAEVRSSVPNQTRASENAHLKNDPAPTTILKKTGNVLKKTVTILKKPFNL
jgi:hypothetical protein